MTPLSATVSCHVVIPMLKTVLSDQEIKLPVLPFFSNYFLHNRQTTIFWRFTFPPDRNEKDDLKSFKVGWEFFLDCKSKKQIQVKKTKWPICCCRAEQQNWPPSLVNPRGHFFPFAAKKRLPQVTSGWGVFHRRGQGSHTNTGDPTSYCALSGPVRPLAICYGGPTFQRCDLTCQSFHFATKTPVTHLKTPYTLPTQTG